MRPLPAQNPIVTEVTDGAMPSIPTLPSAPPVPHSTVDRSALTCSTQRVYPWLLFASTAIAGVFCFMYITKPFIQASQTATPIFVTPAPVSKSITPPAKSSLMPDKNRLPGDKSTPGSANTTSQRAGSATAAFEQTNLRIQHVLTAESPGGHLSKIDLEVPVLYRSRNLRWTPAEVAAARQLLIRLADYQDKSRTLRLEGAELLDAWNRLVGQSIPADGLRADSPTLPTNQQDAADAPRPAGLDTTELIQIQPAGK